MTRQTGSHIRLTTLDGGEHHITIPRHAALRVGTLAGLLGDVAQIKADCDVDVRTKSAWRSFGSVFKPILTFQ